MKKVITHLPYSLPEGEKAVVGRWVYAIKNNVDGSKKYKTLKRTIKRWVRVMKIHLLLTSVLSAESSTEIPFKTAYLL